MGFLFPLFFLGNLPNYFCLSRLRQPDPPLDKLPYIEGQIFFARSCRHPGQLTDSLIQTSLIDFPSHFFDPIFLTSVLPFLRFICPPNHQAKTCKKSPFFKAISPDLVRSMGAERLAQFCHHHGSHRNRYRAGLAARHFSFGNFFPKG